MDVSWGTTVYGFMLLIYLFTWIFFLLQYCFPNVRRPYLQNQLENSVYTGFVVVVCLACCVCGLHW